MSEDEENNRLSVIDAEFFNELANAIGRLRAAFLRYGLEPPKAIELGSIEAGQRFRLSLPKDMLLTAVELNQRDKPEPDVVGHFLGVEIRYPAVLRRRPGGKVDFDDGIVGRAFYRIDGKRIR